MNQSIKIVNLIQKEKDLFFLPFEEEQGFIEKNVNRHDSDTGIIFFTGIPVVFFLLAYLTSIGYFEKHPLMSLTATIIALLFYFFITHKSLKLFQTFYFKRKFRKSSNSNIKQYLENFYNNDFHIRTISEEIKNAVKIDLSMDEYKHLLSQGKNNDDISYGQLLNFIEKREYYKKERQAIEEAKHSINLSPSEIKAYQMEHLS